MSSPDLSTRRNRPPARLVVDLRPLIELHRYHPIALRLVRTRLVVVIMIHQPVLRERRLHLARAARSRNNGMVQRRALRRVHHIHTTRRRLCLQRLREHHSGVRVEVLIQRRAVSQHLPERRDGLNGARDDRLNVLAVGERACPYRHRDVLARELLLRGEPVPGEPRGAGLARAQREVEGRDAPLEGVGVFWDVGVYVGLDGVSVCSFVG